MLARRSISQWVVALMLLIAAAAHVPLIGEHLEEAPYVGWLFIALCVACLVLAAAILLVGSDAVWLLSGAVALAAVLAFLASRTIGLPELGDDVGNWTEPLGFPALGSELLIVALSAVHLLHRRAAAVGPTQHRDRAAQ